MGLRDAKFSLLLVCRDLVRLLVLICLVYLIDKGSAQLLTTKFVIVGCMSRTINFLIFSAFMAILLTVLAIVFELAAESNRFLLETNRTIVLQQINLSNQKKQLLLWNESRYSELHSLPFKKSRISFLNKNKEDLFFASIETLKMESQFIRNIDFSNAVNSNLREDVDKFLTELELFLKSIDLPEVKSLNLIDYRIKFREVQSLLISLNHIQRKWFQNRSSYEKVFSEQSVALSNASSYAILLAFVLEVLIFIYIQFLEIKTERRRIDK